MRLRHTKETIITVSWKDLERFVNDEYPVLAGWSFIAAEQCSNDSTHRFYVAPTAEKYEKEEWERELKSANPQPSAHVVLSKLCEDNHIKPGTYIIEVSW